jgi:hypothetical protein
METEFIMSPRGYFWGTVYRKLPPELEAFWQKSHALFEANVNRSLDSVTFLEADSLLVSPQQYFHHKVKQRFENLLATLRNNPELAGKLTEVLSVRKVKAISRRAFIDKYLMAIPEFRELLALTESEIPAFLTSLIEIIQQATSWLCRRFRKIQRQIKGFSEFQSSSNDYDDKDEKLWPLLMAFKNK